MTISSAELIQILQDVSTGDIGIEEAARRAHVLEIEPGKYRCGTCRFYRATRCHRPGQPPRAEHPQSVRCGDYVYDDPRDRAMPIDHKARHVSRMFK